MSIVEKYETGTNYDITRLCYESGIIKYEKKKEQTKDIPNTFTINDKEIGNAEKLVIYGNSYQETTSGKNKLPNNVVTETINGLTFSKTSDGGVSVKGTATENTIFNLLGSDEEYLPSTDYISKAGNYTLTGCPSGGDFKKYRLRLGRKSSDGLYTAHEDVGEGTNVDLDLTETINCFIGINRGQTVNLVFYPMLRLSSESEEFEPNTNGQPSPSPDYPQEIEVIEGSVDVEVAGKNLFDVNSCLIGQIVTSTGTIVTSTDWNTSDWIEVSSSKEHTLSIKAITSSNMLLAEFDENKEFIQRLQFNGVSSTMRYTPSQDTKYIRLSYRNDLGTENIQLEEGSTATEYEPYIGTTTTIDLQGNFLAKIGDVKDELDVVNGKLIKKVGRVQLNGTETLTREQNPDIGYIRFNIPIQNANGVGMKGRYVVKSTHFKNMSSGHDVGGAFIYQSKLFIYPPSYITSVEQARVWLAENQPIFYYDLAEPYEVQLEPIEIKLYDGINNVFIFSNLETNGIITYGENTNDTLYLDSANPYINTQEQIDNIFDVVKGFNIYSLETGKILGNPAIDCWDIIEIVDDEKDNEVISKTLATNTLTYNGALTQTLKNTISEYKKTENVSKNSNETFKKMAKTEIDNANATIKMNTTNISTIETKINNNFNSLLDKFDNYTPTNDFLTLENSVTQLQTDTYTRTEINTKLTDGSVTKVHTVSGTFDENGMTYEKTGAKTKSTINETGVSVKDSQNDTSNDLLFAGYVDNNKANLNEKLKSFEGQTVVYTKNAIVDNYFIVGSYSRMEDYEEEVDGVIKKGTGVFYLGG